MMINFDTFIFFLLHRKKEPRNIIYPLMIAYYVKATPNTETICFLIHKKYDLGKLMTRISKQAIVNFH